jgi:hypothetical protein
VFVKVEKEDPRVGIYPGRCFLHGMPGLELCFATRWASYQVCIHDFGWLADEAGPALSYRYWGGHILTIRGADRVVVCTLTDAGPPERELWRVELDRMELAGRALEVLTCGD